MKRRDDLKISADRASFVGDNFFTHQGSYDLIFDHTFLCALQPKQRQDWAQQMAKLIKPGGILVGYIYPINPTKTDGPPFALSPEVYRELLSEYFEEAYIKELEGVTYPRRKEKAEHGEMISKWIRKGN